MRCSIGEREKVVFVSGTAIAIVIRRIAPVALIIHIITVSVPPWPTRLPWAGWGIAVTDSVIIALASCVAHVACLVVPVQRIIIRERPNHGPVCAVCRLRVIMAGDVCHEG